MYRLTYVLLAFLGATVPATAADPNSYFEERSKDFGIVPRGPMLVHYFKLTNPTKETLTISSLRVSCGCTQATSPVSQIKPGESTSIMATMDTRRFSGPKAVTIYVTFSSPVYQEMTLLVQANGRDDFAMTPDTLAFGTVRKGGEPKATVQVSFLSDPNFKIHSPKAESNYVIPEVKQIKRQGSEVVYEVSASLRSDLPVGRWFTDVWVQTSNPGMPKLRIPLTVDVQPSIAVSPSGLQFSSVKVGDKSEQKVMVRGDKPFKIIDVQGLSDGVKLDSKPNDAKAVHVLTFVFEPAKVGEVSKALKVVTDGTEREVLIPLRAVGTDK